MECTVPARDVTADSNIRLVDLNSLYAALARVRDRRHARGLRHPLANVLVNIILARLAGQDRLSGIAEWAEYRPAALVEVLPSAHCGPEFEYVSPVLGEYIDLEYFERVVCEFFADQPANCPLTARPCAARFLRVRHKVVPCWRLTCHDEGWVIL